MKNGAILTIGLLLIATAFGTLGLEGNGSDPFKDPSRGYVTHDPIVIEGDSSFNLSNGVRSGAGTNDDPYIIDGWDIDADDTDFGIYIGNTTRFFVIRNCRIHGANNGNGNINLDTRDSVGVTLNNVVAGTVKDNILYDNTLSDIRVCGGYLNTIESNTCSSVYASAHLLVQWSDSNTITLNDCDPHTRLTDPVNGSVSTGYGLMIVYSSSDNTVTYNTFRNFTNDGILISNSDCHRTTIAYNIIEDCARGLSISGEDLTIASNLIKFNIGTGIYADMTYRSNILGNLVSNNAGSGIILNYDGGFQSEGTCLVQDNIVRNNGLDGIVVQGKFSEYYNNSITDNGRDGINIRRADNTVRDNNIEENGRYGIFIEDRWKDPSIASRNQILWNNIINNTANPQARDDCSGNVWSGAVNGNYWNDHTSPDNDTDGIVDLPYFVNVTNNVSDAKPMVSPYDMIVVGPIIPPVITTDDMTSVQVNDTYQATYTAYDPLIASSSLVWDIETNASWLEISGPSISGTPAKDDVGQYWVEVEVFDGDESDWSFFYLTVIPLPEEGTDPDNGTDPNNGTDPDDDNSTDPDDDDGNDTIPGDDDDNGTGHDDDDGNDTIPDDDDDNGTDPDDDDNGNDTIPDDDQDNDNGTWNEMSNKAPSSASIDVPVGKLISGKKFVLSARAFDPDLASGDSLTYDWYIEGIGHVGSGETIELTLKEGKYTIILIVTDQYGLKVEKRMGISVQDEDGASFDPIPLLMAVPVIALLALMVAAVFIFRKSHTHATVDNEETTDWDLDAPESAPINIRTTPGTFSTVRSGPLPQRTGGDLRSLSGPMEVNAAPGLSLTEEKALTEIRSDVLITKRSPMNKKKRELRDLLRKKEGSLDRKTYAALSSILEE